ncbi:putative HNHc nuclease [Weissella minor]|uniref:Phage protein n=1 Tax=Weissella minor TaxID=1620 RepID=A0A0R2JK46_9LACO|nr:putative HNHc nuclease [Weissella minor]KRN77608.1 hypothetical protein IV67_GL001452 [Weissella minor]
MELWGRMLGVQGNVVSFAAENLEELATLSLYTQEDRPEAVLQIPDNRHISAVQRKKAFALMHDMASYCGYEDSVFKDTMMFMFEGATGIEQFSFKDVDMTTARYFISFLLDYALKWHIPLSKSALSYQDDLDIYMYQSLKYRSCVLCGKHADVHHVDAIGNNQFRALADHREKRLVALCRIHHQEAENMGWLSFSELYHVKGIYLEPKMLNQLGIMTYERMKQIDDKQNRTSR